MGEEGFLAGSVGGATLDLRVVILSPTFGVKFTLKKKKNRRGIVSLLP